MATMKFFNVLQPPQNGAEDGMYFVKTADTVMQYIVTDGNVYPLTSQEVFYGVERRRDVADPTFKKIGNSEMHETLPLHNLVRICKVNKNREVVNYFDQTDITKNEDGSPSVIDGSDGQDVAVHYPNMYVILDGGVADEIWAIGLAPFEYKGIKSMHIKSFVESADYVTRDKTTGETRCIQSDDENFAGTGSGVTDGGVGYPLTFTSRYNYEVYAENKGEKWDNWLYVDYLVSQALMYIEYGTRYLRSSAIFGEIGRGWTVTQWSTYNALRPVIKILEAHIGISGTSEVKAKGHLTGIYERTFDFEMDGTPTSVTSTFGVYRGKILWGHLYKYISGVEVEVQSDAEGGKSNVYVQFDPNKIDVNRSDDSFDFMETYQLMGDAPRASGWARLGIPNSGVPATTGGAQSTYMTSYWYASTPETGVSRRPMLFGADLITQIVGVGSARSTHAPSNTNAAIGGGFRAEVQ